MSNVQIPNLGAAIALSGAELFEGVQSGVSVKISAAQIGTYVESIVGTGVTGLSFGTTGLLPAALTGGPITVTGTLVAANGGTGLSSYTIGDLIYASGATALSSLAGVATGNVLISGGIATAPSWGKVDLTTAVSGTLPATNGGTGNAVYAIGDLIYANTTTTLTRLADVATGSVLISGGIGVAPSWGTVASVAVTTISFGTTGLTPNSATAGAVTVAGTLVAANGGTGQSSYAVGDILYASGATALSKLAAVATGNVLISGGVTTAPSWGKVSLTAAVSGTLPAANGGTGIASYAVGDILYASGATTLSALADVATGNVLISGGVTTAPSWGKVSLTTAISGTLPAANGGTGVSNAAGSTITLGGALTFSGAFATTFTVTAGTGVTLPTTGTLATLAGAETLTNKTITTFGGAFTFNPANANFTLSPTGTGTGAIAPATAGTINNMVIGGSTPLAGTFTTLSDSVGNVRSIPHSGADKTTAYTLLTSDTGQYVTVGASGSIVIPDATFSAGNVVTIFNNTTGNITITCTITTAYIAGTDADKATMTLATRGLATILFLSGTVCVVSGNVT